MDPAVKTLKAALESNSKYGAECASPKRAIPGAMFHAMEMQRVPVHQTFYEACYVGSGWQMSPGVRTQSLDLFCEAKAA